MKDKKDTDKKEAGISAAGTPEPEVSAAGTPEPEVSADDNQDTATAEIKTMEDLEACYPQLVSRIRDEVIEQVGNCTVKKVKENMPELYERIVAELQSRGGPDLKVPGFLLEVDDPFAEGTLRKYEELKGMDELRLPYVLPFKDKGTGEVYGELWRRKWEAAEEVLEAEFKNIKAYIAFKSRIITQVLEFYILIANGAGDTKRADAARGAMKKIK